MMHFTHSTSNKANPFKRHRTLTSISSLKKRRYLYLHVRQSFTFNSFSKRKIS